MYLEDVVVVVGSMVNAVCLSSYREIENRIEADHPVVSFCDVLFCWKVSQN